MKARTLDAVDLPDGGFLILDGIRMVRVNYADHAYHVDVVKEDGATLRVASWMGGVYWGRMSFRSRTDEEVQADAEHMKMVDALNKRAKDKARAWASELRWILENR